MRVKQLIPMLNVSDIQRSLAFYQDIAGFELISPPETVTEWEWAHLRANQAQLMLSGSGGPPPVPESPKQEEHENWPVIFYFYPDDVAALHAGLIRQGYRPSPLRVTFYGMKEFDLYDPDGHLLSFGQETDEPPTE